MIKIELSIYYSITARRSKAIGNTYRQTDMNS